MGFGERKWGFGAFRIKGDFLMIKTNFINIPATFSGIGGLIKIRVNFLWSRRPFLGNFSRLRTHFFRSRWQFEDHGRYSYERLFIFSHPLPKRSRPSFLLLSFLITSLFTKIKINPWKTPTLPLKHLHPHNQLPLITL